MQYSESVLEEIRRALINDPGFKFKQAGNKLRRGTCPNCGEPECFVDLDKPGRVSCGRLNNCQWSATIRELYPEIFENLSHRHPATESNPNATADAYLQEVRGFDLSKIQGMYFQANAKHPKKDEYYPAVKVIISQTCYWLRIINADDVRKIGAKTKIVGDFQSTGWVPPGMTLEEGDEVWITEGIFKSMAFLHIGKKSISGLSASNLPRDIIRAHSNKKIVWVVAEDADEAGRNAAAKFRKEIDDMGEICRVAFPAHDGEDWDDAFRDGRLTAEYLRDSFFRGFFFLARTAMEKAFFHYCKYKRSHHVFDHYLALWRYKIETDKVQSKENYFTYPDQERGWNVPADDLKKMQNQFSNFVEIKKICPAKPEFLYLEEDIETREISNCFHVQFENHAPSRLFSAPGTIYKNPDNFCNGLLLSTGYAPFTGNPVDLTIMHDNWFLNGVKFVRCIPFMGYEPVSKTYIYPDFAYCGGQFQQVNKHGFITYNRYSLKCRLSDARATIKKSVEDFTGDWINEYYEAFSLNGMVLLSWWLGTLFAEQIRMRQASWPFLEYTGEFGSGKTSQIKFLWRCLGIDNWEGFDPKAGKQTPAGRARTMTMFSNLPVVLLESGHKDPQRNNNKEFDFNDLKEAFNYGAVMRSVGAKTTGNETRQYIFRGGILIAQNAEVQGDKALLSRIVHCHCTQAHFTKENAVMAERLIQMSAQQLGGFLHAVLRNERQLLEGYFEAYKQVYEEFEQRNSTGEVKQQRIRLCHAQIAAWARQLPLLFGNRLTDEQLARVENHIWDRAKARERRLSGDHPALEQFWSVYEYLHEQSTANGVQEILNHSGDPKQIAINLPHFQEVAANHRQLLPPSCDLTALFKNSQEHPCKGFKTVRSSIFNKVMGCWIFEKGDSIKDAQ